MGQGLVVTIDGKVGASYRAALQQSLADAKATGAAMHTALQSQITTLQSKYSKMDPQSANAAATYQVLMQKRAQMEALHNDLSVRETYSNLKTKQSLEDAALTEKKALDDSKLASSTALYMQEENALAASYVRRTKMSGKNRTQMLLDQKVLAAAQAHQANYVHGISSRESMQPFRDDLARSIKAARAPAQLAAAAATKAAQLEQIAIAARGFNPVASRGGHATGSVGGVVQEVAVIGHEILQGRGSGRIIGSISILGQRLGWLRKIIKTTADAEIDASVAASKLATKMSQSAMAAEAKAVASKLAAVSADQDAGASLKLAAADEVSAVEARKAALAQLEKAAAAKTAAEVAKTNARLIPGAMVPAIAIFTVLAVAIGSALWMWRKMNVAAREFERLMASRVTSTGLVGALENNADAMRDNEKESALLILRKESLADATQLLIDKLHRETQAHLELADAQNASAQADIDLKEKQGRLSHPQAIQARAALEKKALEEKFAINKKVLSDELNARETAFANAKTQETELAKLKEAAEQKLIGGKLDSNQRIAAQAYLEQKRTNEDPEVPKWLKSASNLDIKKSTALEAGVSQDSLDSLERQSKLKAVEDSESALKERLVKMQEHLYANQHGLNPMLHGDNEQTKLITFGMQSVAQMKTALAAKAEEKNKLKDSMLPAEIAAADARSKASQATESRVQIGKDVKKSGIALDEFGANAPKLLAAQEAAIDTKTKMEMMGTRHGPDGLNSMQKLGAFTAQAGNPIIPLHQRTNQLLASILAANSGLKEYHANKQGGVAH